MASLFLLEREIYLHGTQKLLKGVALIVRLGKIMELRGLSISRSPLVGPPLKAELENEYQLPGSKAFSPFDYSSFCYCPSATPCNCMGGVPLSP